jgi:hypothetical protein
VIAFLIIFAILAVCLYLVRRVRRTGGSLAAIYMPVARLVNLKPKAPRGHTAGESGSPTAVRPAL